jgi:hypothetical protein
MPAPYLGVGQFLAPQSDERITAMPHLLMSFEATRAEETIDGKRRPSGQEHIAMTIMDTEKGKVVEIAADATNVQQVERAPVWGETHTASQVLRGGGDSALQVQFDRVSAERDSYRQKHASANITIEKQQNQLQEREKEILELKSKLKEYEGEGGEESKRVIADALDGHAETLALTQNFEDYERAKRLYRRFSGKPWVDEGDDDLEGDLTISPSDSASSTPGA